MNSPKGWVYFLPLGAVSSIERSDILYAELLNDLPAVLRNTFGDKIRVEVGIWLMNCLLNSDPRRCAGKGRRYWSIRSTDLGSAVVFMVG